MFKVDKSLLIGYSAEQMFKLVEDIENYPQFLPWCSQTRIDGRDPQKTIATLFVRYHGVEVHFTTENSKNFPHGMTLRHKNGPFKQLEGVWAFEVLAENACKVSFQLSFSVNNFIIEAALKKVFSHITDTIMDAFVQRARVVYGECRIE